jgi:hypothetical protein
MKRKAFKNMNQMISANSSSEKIHKWSWGSLLPRPGENKMEFLDREGTIPGNDPCLKGEDVCVRQY